MFKRKRIYTLVSLLLATLMGLLIVSSSWAGPQESKKSGPFHSTSTDNGSCGQPWAQDIFDRYFKVKDNKNGTFTVREEFKNGVFITIGGPSPGSCETDSNHGTTVRSGVTGKFEGYLEGTVTSSTYNPNGCSAVGADCSTTAGFLTATFGASGSSFTCSNGYAGCRFNFEYSAGDQNLLFHHWQDTSNGPGVCDPSTSANCEFFRGDIADQ
jgi:hypothetical protein